MREKTALKAVLLGALIGLAAAAFITILVCVVWSWPYGYPMDDLQDDQRMQKVEGIRRLGLVVFVLIAGPVGVVIGAASGALRYFLGRRRLAGIAEA